MKYPLKVWLLTILITPFVLTIAMFFRNGTVPSDFSSAIPAIFFMIIWGSLASSPSLFLFWFLSDDLNDRSIKPWIKKLILFAVGVVLIWVTFFLIDTSLFSKWDFNNYIWPLIYSSVLVVLTITLKTPVSKKS